MFVALCLHAAMAASHRYGPSSPWIGFGNSPQHTGQSNTASLQLDRILWRSKVDTNPPYSGSVLFAHYGSPVVTASNTVILPVKTTSSGGFEVQAKDGETGHLNWQRLTAYTVPAHGWFPTFNVTLVAQSDGSTGVAWPESGGRITIRANADTATSTQKTIAFYGNAIYNIDKSTYDANVAICTPLTSAPDGSVYFGFTVSGSNASGLTSGLAKIDPSGNGHWVAATTLSNDSGVGEMKMNCAPALSNDGSSLYTEVYSGAYGRGMLVQVSTSTLTPMNRVELIDPKSGLDAHVTSDGTESPLVGPDGDVFCGVLDNPWYSNNDRGWLLHFSGDLQTTKVPGAFGWDNTPSIVPSSIFPYFTGKAPYLLFCKYNNYAGTGGDGVNKIAVLNPETSDIDPVSGIPIMHVVSAKAGKTADAGDRSSGYPKAVKEWCVSSAVVDIPGQCILANSEDGKLYRWDLVTNTLSESIRLTPGLGEAYTTTLITPTGHILAINNATVFCVGTLAR